MPSKPAAWMIIPTFYPVIGGAQSQVQSLSQILLARNWTVRVLTRQHSYTHPRGLPARDSVDGVPVVRLYSRGGTKAGSLLYLLGGVWHLLRHGRNCIYHAHDIGVAGWLAVAAKHLLGGWCLIKLRTGRHAYEQYLASGIARRQFSWLLRLTDKVIVVNGEVEALLSRLGIPAARIVRIPNGVDTGFFRPPGSGERAAARQKLGFSPEEVVVLYVGRFERWKGVDVLIRAWARLPDRGGKRARLVLVGDGPERGRLTEMVASYRLQDSVLPAGVQQNVRRYYWAADCFVLPSRTEGLSNALIEAMACGLPVIASRTGGALDIVTEGEDGFLFEVDDEDDLVDKLVRLSCGSALRTSMGTHARQSVVEYADLPIVLERLIATYLTLV